MESDKPTPTKPGAYYLADGRPRVCRLPTGHSIDPSADWLLCDTPHGPIPERADSLAWAADEHGDVVPVPTLEEWRDARARIHEMEAPGELRIQRDIAREEAAQAWAVLDDVRRALGLEGTARDPDTDGTEVDAVEALRREADEARREALDEVRAVRAAMGLSPEEPLAEGVERLRRERDEARAGWDRVAGYHEEAAEVAASLTADRDALLAALDVPEGADPVEWAGLLAEGARLAKVRDDGTVTLGGGIEWARKVDAMRAPPRPLPDGPGWWWCIGTDGEPAPVLVEEVLVSINPSVPGLVIDGVDLVTDVDWLATPDGRAVRCTPPEVDRG